jgi:transcriptional/translational regulatory protein YebC/TACO1
MSGHSKWSTIKHKKGKLDAARGKIFTKLIRELTVATKAGGKDMESNPRLRAAVIAARGSNMPNDTIERAIKRGAGEVEGEIYEELTYEGYGPGGVAILIEATTSNRNRTYPEIRALFNKNGGKLGTDGSVGWMFEQKGVIEIDGAKKTFDQIFEAAVEAGADDVEEGEDETFFIYCAFKDLHSVAKVLEDAKFTLKSTKGTRIPSNTVSVSGDAAATNMKLIDLLDEHDDVQNVYSNADISEEELEKLGLI